MQIINFLTTLGMITNITINLFVDDRVLSMEASKRWLMLFLVENALLVTIFFIKFNDLPSWFEYKNRAKFSYLNTFNDKNKGMITKKKQE